MKIMLKVRQRGKRGYDISSVPFKKLRDTTLIYRKFRWELKVDKEEKEGWLILEAF